MGIDRGAAVWVRWSRANIPGTPSCTEIGPTTFIGAYSGCWRWRTMSKPSQTDKLGRDRQ